MMTKTSKVAPALAGAVVCALCVAGPAFAQHGAQGTHAQGTQARPAKAASAADKAFVDEAASGGLMEVELGRLAMERASSAEVKQFGQRMVNDHSAANDKLKQAASSSGIDVPAAMDAKHKATTTHLQSLKGAEFDRAYMQHMVSDHQKDVAAFEKQSKSASAASIRTFAAETLPTLQEHLREAQRVAKTLGGSR